MKTVRRLRAGTSAVRVAVVLGLVAGICVVGPSADAAGADGELDAVVCTTPKSCLAIGWHFPSLLARRWNGTSWTAVPITPPASEHKQYVSDIACVSVSRCFGVGFDVGSSTSALLEGWNGTRWTRLTAPEPAGFTGGMLTGVSCPKANFCVASGVYDRSDAQRAYVARWNGTAWSITKVPRPGNTFEMTADSISCRNASDCYTVGDIVASTTRTLVMHWNGAGWARVPSPTPPHMVFLTDVSCTTGNFCFAVGSYRQNGSYAPFGLRWTGSTFTLLTTAVPSGTENDGFVSVSCTSPSSCFTVGATNQNNGNGHPWVKRWDGTRWKSVASPAVGNVSGLFDVSCPSPKMCMAVGLSVSQGGFYKAVAMRWNGTKWSLASPTS